MRCTCVHVNACACTECMYCMCVSVCICMCEGGTSWLICANGHHSNEVIMDTLTMG